jgi:hypothetical protein
MMKPLLLKGIIIMNDLVIKLDSLLKDRRDMIDFITEYSAKCGSTPNIWERGVLRIAKHTKKNIDHKIVDTFNKLSQQTDGHALKSFILNR